VVRDTVWVVKTVTTLGAIFSTTGAKLAIIPGCVGVLCCAAAENALVDAQSMAPINNPNDRTISLSIKCFPHQGNRTLDRRRPFFGNSIGNGRDAVAAATQTGTP